LGLTVGRIFVSRFSMFVEKSLRVIRASSGREDIVRAVRAGRMLDHVRTVPGHVAELGVGSGTNALIFGTLIADVFQWKIQYVGFDTFAGYPRDALIRNSSFDEKAFSAEECSISYVQERIRSAGLADTCLLVQGDLRERVPSLLRQPPSPLLASPDGLRFRLLYVDCNDVDAASVGLSAFRDVLSPGALIVIDERRLGGETRAIMDFAEKNRQSYQMIENPGFPGQICLTKVC